MHCEDLIDLTEIAGISRFGDVRLRAVRGATVLDLTPYGGSVIRLEDTMVSNFGAGDFEFYEPPANDSPRTEREPAAPRLPVPTFLTASWPDSFRPSIQPAIPKRSWLREMPGT